jgi:hypothetical protein
VETYPKGTSNVGFDYFEHQSPARSESPASALGDDAFFKKYGTLHLQRVGALSAQPTLMKD